MAGLSAHGGVFEEASDHTDHLAGGATVSPHQHQANSHSAGTVTALISASRRSFAARLACSGIIQDRGAHVVDRDLQWRPARPCAAISVISSIVSGWVPGIS